jgi:UDP-glucuronate 4-epimerase
LKVLVTGSAGFVGFHLAHRLLTEGHQVTGFDGFTEYYEMRLKRLRHETLSALPGFTPIEAKLEDKEAVSDAFRAAEPELVLHMGAQAGVRYSIDNPSAYADSNLVGTLNVLEAARAMPPRHLMFASSSSVYGMAQGPSRETDAADRPVSLYAASKRAGEVMTHSYAHLFGLPFTCLRYFTVYGPWGRPDMALMLFARAIAAGKPIKLFGEGRMQRDFTYIDDVVEAVLRLSADAPVTGRSIGEGDSISEIAPWRVVNIAGGHPVPLARFVAAIEASLGRKAVVEMLPMQPGDVNSTNADVRLLRALTGEVPRTEVEDGIARFVDWLKIYDGIA